MDKVYESLERMKELWLQMGKTTRHSPEYDMLMKEIRAESDAYRALLDADAHLNTTGKE